MAGAAPLSAWGADAGQVGGCILGNCKVALAKCLADGTCIENLVCVNACNNRPDEAACQIRCGDLYTSPAVEEFDTCALTEKKCVPQIQDTGEFPAPALDAVVEQFDMKAWEGRWYITAGLNPLFDTFDCQRHFFTNPSPGKVYSQINWRVRGGIGSVPGAFIDRSVKQQLVQDSQMPGKLADTGGEFLHFKDDWYILGAKYDGPANSEDDYILVYYRGNNDAWLGYGGGTLYQRVPALTPQAQAAAQERLKMAGLPNAQWDKWTVTDNTCGPQPPSRLQGAEMELGRDFARIERELERDLTLVESEVAREVRELGREVANVERSVEESVRRLEKKIEGADLGSLIQVAERAEQRLADAFRGTFDREVQAALRSRREQETAQKRLDKMMRDMPMPGVEEAIATVRRAPL